MKHTEYIIPIGEDAQDYDEMFIGVIRRQPELVRCRDCKYWIASERCNKHRYFIWTKAEDFCSDAERKEE